MVTCHCVAVVTVVSLLPPPPCESRTDLVGGIFFGVSVMYRQCGYVGCVAHHVFFHVRIIMLGVFVAMAGPAITIHACRHLRIARHGHWLVSLILFIYLFIF